MHARAAAALVALALAGAGAPASGRPADTAVPLLCAPAAKPQPVGGSLCVGVRPGAFLDSDAGDCTFGFLYAGSDGRRYAVTAGHCVLTAEGESAWPLVRGADPKNAPAVRDAAGRVVGRFAYAVDQGDLDFALVRIDRGVQTDPQLCYFGGPTGGNAKIDEDVVELRHVGKGLNDSVSARTAVAPFGLYRDDVAYAWGAAYYGDSGSPVIDADGRAVGVVTHLVASGLGDIRLNRLTPHLTRAQHLLKVKLNLLTAPAL